MDNSLKAFDKVLADAQSIKEQGNFLPDCSTKEGYEASKQFVLKVTTPARTALTSAHKEAKAFYLEGGRMVDAKKNELMDMIKSCEAPHMEAYKAVDEEKKRIKAEKDAAVQNGIDQLKSFSEHALNASSEVINSLLEDCQVFDVDPSVYGKRTDEVAQLQINTCNQLTDALIRQTQFEEMQKQQEELLRKQQEIEAKERAHREAEEAQQREIDLAKQREQMRKDAEFAAAEETKRLKLEAEQAELRRIEQEKQAAIDAENARLQAEESKRIAVEQEAMRERQRIEAQRQREAEEAASREADIKHRKSINSQALDCLVAGGLTAEQAKLAVKLIAARKVANVQINY